MVSNHEEHNLEEKDSEKTDNISSGVKTTQQKIYSFLKEIVILGVTAFIVAFLIKTFVVQPFKIEQQSMVPTLYPGERVLVSKFIYRFQEPEKGDIVTFEDVNVPGQKRVLIKRIIATEGETIKIRGGKVSINDRTTKEPYVIMIRDASNYGPREITKDNVFVMGDNRPNSGDSRIFGPIPENRVLGEAFFIYWPLNRMGTID